MSLKSINPANGEEIKSYSELSFFEIKEILNSSNVSQKLWSETKVDFRLECLKNLIEILIDNKKEYSLLISQEMGKPLNQSKAEIDKCVTLCGYYYENAELFLLDNEIEIKGLKSFVTKQPIGLVLGVMPWNFPFWQVFRFAVPTIISGNGAILKHASNVQGCANAIESCFYKSGFPKYIFRNLALIGKNVSKVIEEPMIKAVSITGSTPAGRAVAETAGRVLKKTVLELGGSDPYIILDDADIETAINACIDGRILNTGQSCISAKRIIVVEKIYETFLEKLEKKINVMIMGDPLDDVDIGPMVSEKARNELHYQVNSSIKKGATLHLGGFIPEMKGSFYPVTLLSNVSPGMVAFDEELFGPVFALIKAKDDKNAIDLANKTQFGLGAAVFTCDLKKGEEIAKKRLQAGACFVNDYVKSDPRLPFGGIKDSGYGRELSDYGIMEFVNIKTIVIRDSTK